MTALPFVCWMGAGLWCRLTAHLRPQKRARKSVVSRANQGASIQQPGGRAMNKTGRTHGRGNVRRAVLVALAVVATTLPLAATTRRTSGSTRTASVSSVGAQPSRALRRRSVRPRACRSLMHRYRSFVPPQRRTPTAHRLPPSTSTGSSSKDSPSRMLRVMVSRRSSPTTSSSVATR
jgi:hypothetical protein